MGVPSLFAYFFKRYHKCIRVAVHPSVDNKTPNGVYDCLYIDLNGILHACSHPSSKLIGYQTEEEVFSSVFEFIVYLTDLIQPRKILYIAVDGVAPRSKMNQQRGRRWVAASEHEKQKKENIDRFIEMETDGWIIPDEIRDTLFNIFDSGSITPGTIWMERYNSFIFNFERIVEDVVFLIFLAGNDFLPHIQTMSVSEGIIERIFVVYKRIISKTGIYFTQGDAIIPAQISIKNYERWSGK
ncbi:MAG: putative 5'-3' exoribonuclease 1 [Streblomastix strix]|uniref:Putative 5'-3' exoribonuclease 1 n=1 Tax=Streblomastix strix TaxID=222440 RepID=A0A5J4UY49_9EUKA|nr:MAG: putative 5'-3' exoribonuclease 1 [Streblomastix strix]